MNDQVVVIASESCLLDDQQREYSPDEKRVSDYIQSLTDGAIGSGDDPIGFLIASHSALLAEQKSSMEVAVAARSDERRQCASLVMEMKAQGYVTEFGRISIAEAILARGTSLKAGLQFGEQVSVTYTNYRGETARRLIVPKSIRFGSTWWHPEPQLLLLAFDLEKQEDREFAVKDFAP